MRFEGLSGFGVSTAEGEGYLHKMWLRGKLRLGEVEQIAEQPCASDAGSDGRCRAVKISEADSL